ncbi:MAG TPA: ABC transporter substrate-binding protein, partial [Rhizobiaceae bacterium]|nr:ABC transporter substrate-binding protein [Rhizobiaceae bacterium]
MAALAQDSCPDGERERHGASLIGELNYPAGFERYDFANPDAPKGGTLRLSETGGFDTFNPILAKGEAPVGLDKVFETLLSDSMEEISTEYGLLALSVSWPCDYSSVTYRLNPLAK